MPPIKTRVTPADLGAPNSGNTNYRNSGLEIVNLQTTNELQFYAINGNLR